MRRREFITLLGGAPERLSRHNIAITNREAGDEGEIERITHRPTLDEASQQTKGYLNR
jgi:hypothetical protein